MAVPAGTQNMHGLAEAGVPVTLADATVAYATMAVRVDKDGNAAPSGTSADPLFVSASGGALSASTDRSGTATTTSGGLNVAANASRKSLVGQNVSAVNIGFNEQGGTAVIGAAGTYTVAPGVGFSISTNKAVNFIAASGTAAVTMTET